MANKVLIVYASCGEGHKNAAVGAGEILNAKAVDFLDYTHPFIKALSSGGYRFAAEVMPFLWFCIYEVTKLRIVRVILSWVNKLLFSEFKRFLDEEKPDCLILTHFFPLVFTSLDAAMKTIVILTDLKVHPCWIHEGVDRYLVSFDFTKEDLVKSGINEEKVAVCGFPLRRGFFEPVNEDAIRERFSLDEKPLLLVFSSTRGKIPFIEELIALFDRFNFFVIYGHNGRLKKFLDGVSRKSNLRYREYYGDIWEIMEVAHAVITKPGGLTVFEAIEKKKPLVFTHYIWGQEGENLKLLKEHKVGFHASDIVQLRKILEHIEANNAFFHDHYPLKLEDPALALKEIVHAQT